MNCLIVDDEEMSRNIVRHFVEQTDFLNLVGICSDAIEAANFLKKENVDLIFLDIEMPGMTGYELLESFSENPPQIILVTGKKEYAADAFNYDVTDYLVKPLTYSRFLKAVTRAQERLSGQPAGGTSSSRKLPDDLYVRSDSKIVKVNFNEIYYVEALADYIMIFTADSKLIVHSTMKGFQSRLPQEKFVRVHRSYIINADKIEAIENLFVVINKKHIPIGASYKDEFMKRLNLL
jgi:DNA-binding LytR/AlgR family response regulator